MRTDTECLADLEGLIVLNRQVIWHGCIKHVHEFASGNNAYGAGVCKRQELLVSGNQKIDVA